MSRSLTRTERILGTALVVGLALALAATRPALAQSPSGVSLPSENEPQRTPTVPRPGTSAGIASTLAPSDAELEGAIDPKTYVLGPGDGLVLSLVGRISMDAPLEVDPEGDVWIPEFGRMRLAGLTLEQARAETRKRFRGDTRGVDITLRLVRLRRFKVYVVGEVAQPGAIEASAVTRVSDAIRRAGGITERASQRNVEVRAGDSTALADLISFERRGDALSNPTVSDGAVVTVPPRHRTVTVHAPVAYPGDYEHRTGDKLSDLIALAGPFDPSAMLDRARLLRFTNDTRVDSIPVDLRAVMRGETDVPLEEGDRLFVPAIGEYHVDRNVSITGAVGRPGTYPLNEGVDRVSNLIARAGGFNPDANTRSVLVVRLSRTPQTNDPEFDRLSRLSRSEMTDNEYQTFQTKLATARAAHVVDMSPLSRGGGMNNPGNAERDILLEPGDAIYVERNSHAVRVAGEVRWPGFLSYDATMDGEDYIEIAGGFTGRASKGRIRLTRAVSGQTLLLKDAGRVEPGDLIFVPEKRDVNYWTVLRDLVLVAGSVAAIVIAIRE
jgi:protein involved in polysaccharide export with SLBB domain